MNQQMDQQMIQRSPEWYAARCGRVTASRVGEVIGRLKGGGWAAPRGKYMDQIIAERLTGRAQDMRNVWSLQQRLQLEPEARIAYSYFTDNDVHEVGFIQHPAIEDAGASPDGLVGADGGIEIKCLDAATHVRLIGGDDSIILEYLPQIHFGMACTGRQWCDFVSYSPFMPPQLKVITRRIARDETCITGLEGAVRVFLTETEERLAMVLAFKAAA